jgi:class 3 adenylate cyclase
MAVATLGRTLAAILFTDMVDSTMVAEELGDRRWKALIDQHHRIVRQQLKRFGGRELDTAGDGFFASFREPAAAIACACAAAEAVRDLGIQIRAGVHFGECERIGKKLGGISVVVGARIMALGGAGDVLISSTAAELTKGAGFGLVDRGLHVLKGVDDQWRVFAVTAVDGEPRAEPLSTEEAREHRSTITTTEVGSRRRLVAAAVIGLFFVAAGATVVAWPNDVFVPAANTVSRIKAGSNTFDQSVSITSASQPQLLTFGDGLLWVADIEKKTVSGFDPAGSAAGDLYGTPSTPTDLAFTDGRVWISYGFSSDPHRGLDVLDPAKSGLSPAPFSVPAGSYPIAVGPRVVWVADPLNSALVRYDVDTDDTTPVLLPEGSDPIDLAASSAGDLWVAAGREPLVFHLAFLPP